MPWLVLDTACPIAVVAVVRPDAVDDAAVIAEVTLAETRRHAEALPGAVDTVLAKAGLGADALDGIAAGTGPGSFIGVRTGLAFAKGLGRAIDRPVVGVSSLSSLALSTADPSVLPPGRGAVVIDARRGERYVARVVHEDAGAVVVDAEARAVADVDVDLQAFAFVVGGIDGLVPGPGSSGLPLLLPRGGPSALGMARALRRRPRVDERATLVPTYVRPPDAKLPSVDPARNRPADVGPEDHA